MTDNITIPRATVKQALDALERALETSMRQALKARIPECGEFAGIAQDVDWAATALTAALEQQQAEPVAWIVDGGKKNGELLHMHEYALELVAPKIMCKPLYTAPPKRQPLTVKEINALPEAKGYWPIGMNDRILRLIRAAEAAHGIKEGA